MTNTNSNKYKNYTQTSKQTKTHDNKTTPWRAEVKAPGTKKNYVAGYFAIKEDAARAYDAEIRRRGWTHLKRLNFPGPADSGALPPSSAVAAAGPSGVRGAE